MPRRLSQRWSRMRFLESKRPRCVSNAAIQGCLLTIRQKLRVAALKCLGILPNAVKYEVLHPHKAKVLRQLAAALDDRKREVRRMAVDTRAVWCADPPFPYAPKTDANG